MNGFTANWQLVENGLVIQSGTVEDLTAQADAKQGFVIPYDTSKMQEGHEYYLRIGFQTKNSSKWAQAGHEITFSEFKLQGNYCPDMVMTETAPEMSINNESIVVTASDGIIYTFDKQQGCLVSLTVNGSELFAPRDLQRGFLFDHDIAWIDNYVKSGSFKLKEYAELKLDKLEKKGESVIKQEKTDLAVIVTIENSFRSPYDVGYDEIQVWQIDGRGSPVPDYVFSCQKSWSRFLTMD